MLCGDPLPWVENCKHLGNYIRNKIDGMKNYQRIKQAHYINKNNELEQEFHFVKCLKLSNMPAATATLLLLLFSVTIQYVTKTQ